MNAFFAEFVSETSMEAFGLAAVLVTLAGIWLQWQRPAHVSDIEEALKDGTLPPDKALQRIRRIERRAVTWVIAGMILLVLAGIGWVRHH